MACQQRRFIQRSPFAGWQSRDYLELPKLERDEEENYYGVYSLFKTEPRYYNRFNDDIRSRKWLLPSSQQCPPNECVPNRTDAPRRAVEDRKSGCRGQVSVERRMNNLPGR